MSRESGTLFAWDGVALGKAAAGTIATNSTANRGLILVSACATSGAANLAASTIARRPRRPAPVVPPAGRAPTTPPRHHRVFSHVHIEDAAAATAVAVEHGQPGIYNVVDDEPAPVREWLPVLASALDAKPPRRIPRWLGRPAAGETATLMMTDVRGPRTRRPSASSAGSRAMPAGGRASHRDWAKAMTEEEFDELRPSAFAIAYRMLGSVTEAEDVVQEGFLRLHRARQSGERIESPRGYLSTVVSRLSLDHLRSGRVRRESYVGEWLPEPLVASADDDPARKAEMADSLSLAFLVLLESLSPEQRAAFLLHDVFDYRYREIAAIVGKSEDNVRQLATRARRHFDPTS